MRLILTHEQADFDAVASLLAARLLDERALAALPVRVNRNVRSFLTLYGADLPFVPWHDVPREPLEAVTLVDTQTLPSVRGLTAATPVRVIDHHPRRADLPAHWQVHTEPVGAATTLLLEAMQDRLPRLSQLQATLLLLGIYEDTGSLSYEGTTARDVRAAAFLLEQGASLGIAREFLNPPLTAPQRMVYDILLANAEVRVVQGATVAVAHAQVEGLTDDIAPLAHKLRDTLEPDALFVLVSVPAGVQLVARATGDQVDLPAIVAHFGGGGHRRAAAALVKGRTLEDVRTELWEVLPRHIRPPLTVGEIMSRRPQVLTRETPVEEADRLMRTFGYEGYPVVENGRVVGLLTRRAVDRALSHGLRVPVARLMEAGEVTIRPDDPIDRLQQLMTDTGWGQIPVVDENGSIAGIVTRTDLIKTLAPHPRRPGMHNLAARLESALPPARLALLKAAAAEAEAQGQALYIVGGFVRDLLLERPSLDFDLVVEGNAIALARALGKRYGGRVVAHRKFGTAKWQIVPIRENLARALAAFLPPEGSAALNPADLPDTLDLVTARTEFYTRPTALPTVAHGSIKLDLHRRDFTINTLALRLDGRHYGELHDYWGGLEDLQRGVIRVLHSLSFVDDPTRMLRAVRFEQRFGFRIEPRTLQLLTEARDLLEKVSGDRIRHELDAMLAEPRAAAMLGRLAQLELLEAIHHALRWNEAARKRLQTLGRAPWPPSPPWDELPPAVGNTPLRRALGYALWLMGLEAAEVASVGKRLGFPRALQAVVVGAATLWARRGELAQCSPSALTFALEDHPLAAAYALYLAAEGPTLRERLARYMAEWRRVRPRATGHTLRALGVPPGPRYREILRTLRAAWLDGEIRTPEEEQTLLQRLVDAR